MITNPPIETTPLKEGGNLAASERALGQEVKRLLKIYDRQIEKHHEQIAEIHATILEIGRRMASARALAPTAKGFAAWCDKNGMDTGRFKDQQERSAAMIIAHLTDEGVVPHGLDEDDVPREEWLKLDLANCMRTAPTNILKWARKDQPELFPHIARKQHEEARKQALKKRTGGKDGSREEIVEDDIGDLYSGNPADIARGFLAELLLRGDEEALTEFLQTLCDEVGPKALYLLVSASETVRVRDEGDA